jgi:hypothetical protein
VRRQKTWKKQRRKRKISKKGIDLYHPPMGAGET